jgi:hypothetical protein
MQTNIFNTYKNEFDFLCRLLSPELMKYSYVAGGALVSEIQGDAPRDIDIFFQGARDVDDVVKALNNDRISMSLGHNDFKLTKTDKSYHLRIKGMTVLNLVTAHYGNPPTIVNDFDFVHTQVYCNYLGSEIVFFKNWVEDYIKSKILKWNTDGSPATPQHAISRMIKFIDRGYTIDMQSLKKVLEAALPTEITQGGHS